MSSSSGFLALFLVLFLVAGALADGRVVADPARDGPGGAFLRLDKPVGSAQSYKFNYTLHEPDGREVAAGSFSFQVPAGAALSSNRLAFGDKPAGVYRLRYRPLVPGTRSGDVGVIVRGTSLLPSAAEPPDFADYWKRALFRLPSGTPKAG
jgi:hypothetical protein